MGGFEEKTELIASILTQQNTPTDLTNPVLWNENWVCYENIEQYNITKRKFSQRLCTDS